MSVIVLTPIKAENPGDHAHVDALREIFERDNWKDLEPAYFSNYDMLHMARFQIIEHMVPAMGDDKQPPDELMNNYLMFVAEIDGQAVHLYDHLYRQEQQPIEIGSPENVLAGAMVRSIWSHCVGYPDVDHLYLFRRYMRHYEIGNLLYYTGVPNTRNQILEALCLKGLTAAFLVEQQDPGLTPAQQDAILATYVKGMDQIRHLQSWKLQELKDFLYKEPEPGLPPDFNAIVVRLGTLEEVTP